MSKKKMIPIIHIIGLPGAGKTTLAKRLSKALKIPILCIGRHRVRFPMTPIGEADAWLTLFQEISRHKWKNCILETTGLNCREGFLKTVLPFENIFTIKLEASEKTLFRRIAKKDKKTRVVSGFTAWHIVINMNLSGSSLSAFIRFMQIVVLIRTG